jgi:hypothetical protein
MYCWKGHEYVFTVYGMKMFLYCWKHMGMYLQCMYDKMCIARKDMKYVFTGCDMDI